MTDFQRCQKAAQASLGLKKAIAYLESHPIAFLIATHLLMLVGLVLVEVARV